MIVRISADPAAGAIAAVAEHDDLTRLHVEVDGVDAAGADSALRAAALGSLDGDTAWLSVPGLREQGGSRTPDWATRFAAMVDYAAAKGWCSPDRTHLQAHVERTSRKADA